MHGIPSLVKARTTRSRVFWGAVCVVGMGMFLFMLVSLIFKYYSYPVVVKIAEVCFVSSIVMFIVRSPFRAKHHVVVQYMAAGPKCPLPPPPCGAPPPWPDPPTDPPTPMDSMTGGGQGRIDEQGRIDNITDAARDFALQLP